MKEKISIEDFIRSHREEFDHLTAPGHLWKRIQPSQVRELSIWKWTTVAASALLLISLGYIIGTRSGRQPDIAGWDEYQQTEQYYESRIREKMDRIKSLSVSEEVMSDIQVLDDVYLQLKAQLLEDPDANTQLLLNAMIRHHQQKLEVMEEILNRVDKYQPVEDANQEM